MKTPILEYMKFNFQYCSILVKNLEKKKDNDFQENNLFCKFDSGFEVKSAFSLPPDWKENIPYTLDSVQRYSYQSTQQPDDLLLPVTRYGSNKKKQISASGTSKSFCYFLFFPCFQSTHGQIRSFKNIYEFSYVNPFIKDKSRIFSCCERKLSSQSQLPVQPV